MKQLPSWCSTWVNPRLSRVKSQAKMDVSTCSTIQSLLRAFNHTLLSNGRGSETVRLKNICGWKLKMTKLCVSLSFLLELSDNLYVTRATSKHSGGAENRSSIHPSILSSIHSSARTDNRPPLLRSWPLFVALSPMPAELWTQEARSL